MKRDPAVLSKNVYDLLVIGGGIHGACVAWDASLRGLSVALVDKGDFGSATSSNSHKIIHGGLRYLQHADFRRMRESIHERMVLMRIAPNLIHPLPFLIPTYGHFMRGKEIMSLALMVNDLVSFDRNQLEDPQKYIPRGRVISKSECLQLFPGVDERDLTGGAIWYDCQIYNSERMILSFLRSAEKAGADMANYVEVTGFLQDGNRVRGVKAKDVLTGKKLDVQAKVVVNTSGPWVNRVLGLLDGRHHNRGFLWSKAIVLVVSRPLIQSYAVGVSRKSEDPGAISSKGSRFFFITPWRNYSLIGTAHIPYYGDPDDFKVTEKDILGFIREINEAYPAAALKREDVNFFYGGLLPVTDQNSETGHTKLTEHHHVYDHKKMDGVDGLVSVVGVKYTTARYVAQKVIDLVFMKLGKKPPKCRTAETPLYGGDIERFNDFIAQETEKRPRGLGKEVVRHLIYNYGSEYPRVLTYLDENPGWGQRITDTSYVIIAEVIHAIREEMAQNLIDVILRRTELGSAGNPGDECLKICAAIMATELGWDESRIQREFEKVRAV